MADKEKPPEVKKLPKKPPLPPRRAATANAIDKKDLEKAAVLSKTSTSTSFGINGGDEDVKTDNTNPVQTLENLQILKNLQRNLQRNLLKRDLMLKNLKKNLPRKKLMIHLILQHSKHF